MSEHTDARREATAYTNPAWCWPPLKLTDKKMCGKKMNVLDRRSKSARPDTARRVEPRQITHNGLALRFILAELRIVKSSLGDVQTAQGFYIQLQIGRAAATGGLLRLSGTTDRAS